MKVFDSFVYSGEKQILLNRLNYLNPYVDYFLIVDSKLTFSARSREVDKEFQEQVRTKYGQKIRWQTLDTLKGDNAWERESFQRQALKFGFKDIQPGDIIMLSDVDEIPSHDFLRSLSNLNYEKVLIAKMQLFRYCSHLESRDPWYGTIAMKYFDQIPDFQTFRLHSVRYWLEDPRQILPNGGYHLTAFLNAKQFRNKIISFSHTELNTFPFNNEIFLYFLMKLGLTLDGNEVLGLNSKNKYWEIEGGCSSIHKYDLARVIFAKLIQPIIKNIFKKRVISLSSPN